jgi:hypothetical protein
MLPALSMAVANGLLILAPMAGRCRVRRTKAAGMRDSARVKNVVKEISAMAVATLIRHSFEMVSEQVHRHFRSSTRESCSSRRTMNVAPRW